MSEPVTPRNPGGTYGPGDAAAPAQRDRYRTDQHLPGPDPSFSNPADAGHEPVEPEPPLGD